MTIFLRKSILTLIGVLINNFCLAQSTGVDVRPSNLLPKGLSFGASLAGSTNFSIQDTEANCEVRLKNSTTFAIGELLAAYTWPKGWRLESGLGVGSVAAVTLDAYKELGQGATISFGTIQIPLRLYRHIYLGNSRFTLSPHIGVQNVTISIGEKSFARNAIYSGRPNYGSFSQHFASIKQNTLTYQLGASINYIARKFELGLFTRYTNSFGNPVVATGRWEYDREGVEQPALISKNRLESISMGLSIRRTFYAR